MDSSEESPDVDGLKLFEGHACYLPEGLKIPHMGWNKLDVVKNVQFWKVLIKSTFILSILIMLFRIMMK